MKINELEKLLGLSKANIRYYESEGLILPKRTENGYRNYTEDDAELLRKIIIYRKLGVSIAEIKAVLKGEKSLNEAVTLSIGNMKKDIDTQNRAIDICNKIIAENITDSNFDVEYFWNEISGREAAGSEFIDIASIDITPFKNRRLIKALIIISIALFIFGIAYAAVCNNLFITDDNADYKEKQQEIITADTVDTVKIDEENGLIYVFYNNATCINTYDFSGNFEWAVSVPKMQDRGYCYFYLEDNKIYIDCENDVYIYNAVSGEYIERAYADDLGLTAKRERFDELHSVDIKKAEKSNLIFDLYNVYFQTESEKIDIVQKPFYTLLQSDFVGYAISMLAALGIAVITFLSKFRKVNAIEVNENEISKGAKINRNFYLALAAAYCLYAVINLLFTIFGFANLAIGIFPATALLIISFIAGNTAKKRYNKSELKYTGIILHYSVIAYVFAFISALISTIFL